MAEVFNVTIRKQCGKYEARRMRRSGHIPAVLYGHGEETVHLTLSADEVATAVRHGGHVVDLSGDVSESALIRAIQWDAMGLDILHLDLTRVSATEKVETTVVVELRGEAPGTKEGGIVDHHLHEIEIECLARSIPERLEVNINSLHLDEAILAKDLKLPDEVTLLTDENEIVVQCVAPREEIEEAAPAEAGEPEVIRREREDEEAEGNQ